MSRFEHGPPKVSDHEPMPPSERAIMQQQVERMKRQNDEAHRAKTLAFIQQSAIPTLYGSEKDAWQ